MTGVNESTVMAHMKKQCRPLTSATHIEVMATGFTHTRLTLMRSTPTKSISHEINFHEINFHKINSHKINPFLISTYKTEAIMVLEVQ